VRTRNRASSDVGVGCASSGLPPCPCSELVAEQVNVQPLLATWALPCIQEHGGRKGAGRPFLCDKILGGSPPPSGPTCSNSTSFFRCSSGRLRSRWRTVQMCHSGTPQQNGGAEDNHFSLKLTRGRRQTLTDSPMLVLLHLPMWPGRWLFSDVLTAPTANVAALSRPRPLSTHMGRPGRASSVKRPHPLLRR
jgi:hypothetical protein